MQQLVCIFDNSPLDKFTVRMYEKRIRNGEGLPAIVIWGDGTQQSLLDGRHRVEAMKRCGFEGVSNYYSVNCPVEKATDVRRRLNSKSCENYFRKLLTPMDEAWAVSDQVIANPPYQREGEPDSSRLFR